MFVVTGSEGSKRVPFPAKESMALIWVSSPTRYRRTNFSSTAVWLVITAKPLKPCDYRALVVLLRTAQTN